MTTGSSQSKVVTTTRGRVTGGVIAAGVLGALLVVFAVLNSQRVRVHWIVTTHTAPLILVIAASALVGFAVGWLLHRRSTRPDQT